ncbi:hypothetical protein F4778DRAFT_300659 [Xylariomycetidae sp. FL2044]|nr:hypothetical protein F4778DRAFT_300659 [Xylariomycetidae sp. FL2044]
MSSTEVATTADLPTGEPVPSSAAPPSTGKPKPFPLRDLLAATPSNVDAFLAHLQRCLTTPSGIDTVLLFLCYTSRLGAAALEKLTGPAIQARSKQILALASSLPPSATIIFTSKVFPSPSVALVLNFAKRLKALSTLLSDARTFLRLWGLLGMYFWARKLILKWREDRLAGAESRSPEDRIETSIAWTQLVACVIFQSLENGAYLASKGVFAMEPAAQAKAGRWSARFWGTFVGIEIGRLFYESHKRARRTREEKFAGGKTVTEFQQEEREWSESWRKSVVRNMAWAPLTLHWSLEQGLVSELTIGALASIPGFLQMRDLWRRTAEEDAL